MQGLAVEHHRWHHGHFGLQQFGCKVVFFLNLFTAPAPRPVKLEHHRRTALYRLVQVRTVDTVFVRAERQQTAVGPQAQILRSVHHPVGGEFCVGVARVVGVGHAPIVAQRKLASASGAEHSGPLVENDSMRQPPKRLHRLIRQGLVSSLLLALAILGLGGVGFWVIDPGITSLSDGLWLAFTTAATVGFGDVVPSTHASRAFSVLVVLLGLAVLSLVTASLSAIFVEKEVEDKERQIEKDLMREIRHLRQEVAELRRDITPGRPQPPDIH